MSFERFRSPINNIEGLPIEKGLYGCHRKPMPMLKNILLVWLDSNVNKQSDDTYKIISSFRQASTNIKSFDNCDSCIEFLQRINDDRICMIVSGSYGQQILPLVHSMNKIDSIFIFCRNKNYHEKWTKTWSKIKGVCTEIDSLRDALIKINQQYEQDPMSMSFVDIYEYIAKKRLDQIDRSFVNMYVLKDILLRITFDRQQSIDEYVDYCRNIFTVNSKEIHNIKKFEHDYPRKSPIDLYKSYWFLSSMLNRALNMLDMNLIIKLGFFITDLHRYIQQVHKQQVDYGSKFYCGQGIEKSDWNKLKATKSGLLSFNSFILADQNRNIQMNLTQNATLNNDMVGVLFVFNTSSHQSITPYALISDNNPNRKQNNEVLFTLHSIFHISSIKPINGHSNTYRVELSLANNYDGNLGMLLEDIQQRYRSNNNGWYRLGEFLQKLEHYEKAQEIYENLLEQTKNDHDAISLYNQLGSLKDRTGKYEEAIVFYKKALSKQMQLYPRQNHRSLALTHRHIANAYYDKQEYNKALLHYKNAFDIQQRLIPLQQSDIIASQNDIGHTYYSMGEYAQAVSAYDQVLKWRLSAHSSDYHDLISAHNNLALAQYNLGEYKQALSLYQKVLSYQTHVLRENHLDLALTYSNIGLVYNAMSKYQLALSSYKEAMHIQKRFLPTVYPDLARTYSNIGVLYGLMNENQKALDSHKTALSIRQNILVPNHPDLAVSYNNIGIVREQMKDYQQAYASYEKAVKIAELSLPTDHAKLTMYTNNLKRLTIE